MATEKLLAEWFWVDRWMGSSAFGLPLEARGLYREMLSQAWRRGAALPNDHQQIQRFVGVTPQEWKRSWPQVERFWKVSGAFLINETQLEVYTDATARVERASRRGQAGAQALHKQRSGTESSNGQAVPEPMLEGKPPSPSPSPIRESKEHSLSSAERRAGRLREELYPQWYSKHRHGARLRLIANALEYQDAVTLCRTWDDERLEKLATLVLTTDDEWISKTDRGFKIFALKATWADERLAAWEQEHGVKA